VHSPLPRPRNLSLPPPAVRLLLQRACKRHRRVLSHPYVGIVLPSFALLLQTLPFLTKFLPTQMHTYTSTASGGNDKRDGIGNIRLPTVVEGH
jgi:hypothetical protein